MLNVLVIGTQWPGLDIATDTQDTADASFLNAIYGQLFELAPGNKVDPDEATGYKFSNNYQTVTINIRHGMKFFASTASKPARAKIFQQINNREDQQFDAVWLYYKPVFAVSTKALVPGAGLGNTLGITRWEYLGVKKS